jgi:hypothetical protein
MATTSATPSASSSVAGPSFPIPPAPPGADPEEVNLAVSICAAAYEPTLPNAAPSKRAHPMRVGCRSHPPFVAPEEKPDGTLPRYQGDETGFCAIDRVYRGSFSRPGAVEAVVSLAQCRDGDEWDMGMPGSAVLAEQIGGRWRAVAYERAANLTSCKQARLPGGRDILVCQSGFGAFSTGMIDYAFVLDFARKEEVHAGTLAILYSDMDLCNSLQANGNKLPSGVTYAVLEDVAVTDVNHDGLPDVVLAVERSHIGPSPGLDDRVRASCKRGEKLDRKHLVPPTKTRLELLGDGTSFALSAESAKELAAWTSESPENLNGLSGAAPPPLVR